MCCLSNKHIPVWKASLIFSQDKNKMSDSSDFKSIGMSKNVMLLTRSVIIYYNVVIYRSK